MIQVQQILCFGIIILLIMKSGWRWFLRNTWVFFGTVYSTSSEKKKAFWVSCHVSKVKKQRDRNIEEHPSHGPLFILLSSTLNREVLSKCNGWEEHIPLFFLISHVFSQELKGFLHTQSLAPFSDQLCGPRGVKKENNTFLCECLSREAATLQPDGVGNAGSCSVA